MNRRALLPVGGGLLLLAVAFAFVVNSATGTSITEAAKNAPSSSSSAPPTSTSPARTTPTSPAPASCTDPSVTYYALQAPVGSNNFGPALGTTDPEAAYKRLQEKMCSGDPLFAATMVAYKTGGLKLSADNVEAQAKTYASNKTTWSTAAKDFLNSIESYGVVYDPHTYQTLGMVPNGSDTPRLVKSNQKVVAGYVLVLHFNDGTVRQLRLICDLQPVEDTFPNVKIVVVIKTQEIVVETTSAVKTTTVTKSTTTSTPPRTTTTTTTTRTTSYTPPPPPPPPRCPCIAPTSASQPVPTPPKQTSSVPSTRPPAQTTAQPTPTTTSNGVPVVSAPPTSGDNGGSNSNPLVTGTPLTGDTSSHTTTLSTPTGGVFG